MKYLRLIKSILFSLFLIYIYWDSTIWKITVYFLGDEERRITYGLLSIVILSVIATLYFSLFSLIIPSSKKKKKRKKQNDTIAYILVAIFCFKFAIFGDLGIYIDQHTNPDSFVIIESPQVNRSSLKVYNIGQVKGSNGFYDIYKGFYLIKDKNEKQYLICSRTVSGPSLELDILSEASKKTLKIYLDKSIKPNHQEEVNAYLQLNALRTNTHIYSIKSTGFVLFFLRLLYWVVYSVVIILIGFYISLSLPN